MKLNRLVLIGGLFGAAALAQDPATVNQRRENQQDRVANGIQSGQLTAGETKNVEGGEANLNREIRDDRQANGGALTQAEKQQVNRQQNNLSNKIYQDKHNANTAHYGNNEVGQRRENQQDRIAQQRRSDQRIAERRPNRASGKSRARHQSAGFRGSPSQRRQTDRPTKAAHQSRAEPDQQQDLQSQALRVRWKSLP